TAVPAPPEAHARRRAPPRRHDVDLRPTAPVGLETDAAAVWGVAWRGIDGVGVGKPRGGLGTQIHEEQVRIAALLQAHDYALTIRGEPRRECHAGEVADNFPRSGLGIAQIDARLALAVRPLSNFFLL